MNQDQLKQLVGQKAVEYIQDGMQVGSVGFNNPKINLIRVDLPVPLFPIKP